MAQVCRAPPHSIPKAGASARSQHPLNRLQPAVLSPRLWPVTAKGLVLQRLEATGQNRNPSGGSTEQTGQQFTHSLVSRQREVVKALLCSLARQRQPERLAQQCHSHVPHILAGG